MGRDWSWLGGGKKKSKKEEIKTPPPSSSLAGNITTAAGCMSAVFNIFDFHHLQFPINDQHLHLPKGVDAPRNSLASTEETVEETPFSPTRKDGDLNISMGIKIKTNPQAISSLTATESYSPSVKSPTLVARLMGLDLVPDNYRSSPPPSSSSSSNLIDLKTPTRSSHTNKNRHYSLQRNSVDGGTRSLPETPRISLGRRSVDVNCYEHQRSSLHLRDNNSNINVSSEREYGIRLTRVKEMKIHDDKENRSPQEYARQIVMQLKENVSRRRRMGTDITNKEQQSREIHDSKKASKITIITHNSSSISPRLGLTEIPETKPTSPQTNNVVSKILETTMNVQDNTKLSTDQEEPQGEQGGKKKEKQRKSAKKCKKTENFKLRLVKPPQTMQEEPFVRSPATSNNDNTGHILIQGDKSSCKKTPLSINDLINFTSVPTTKKKDSSPHHKSLRETQPPRNRASEIPSFQSQSQSHITPISGGELEYIKRILRRTGIERDTQISYVKWFSPSHPLDPSIFYFLEHFAITLQKDLAFRCNRKLVFHLVDEVLVDIINPHISLKPWLCRYPIQSHRNVKGSELVDEFSRIIERLPLAECLVLEDIDALVAGDFPKMESELDEEGEGIVMEIEREILEKLVTETTIDYYATWIKTAPLKSDDDVNGMWGVHVTRYSSNDGSHHDSSSLFRRLKHPRG